ncbi:hypothetical protein KUTeg_018535 [Tegillarca granosa]|uniref:Uncharacterized protein n=1 Tax=Tegillarca granosa TaxID=220873 RepID=A0ABQ9EM00_TEGGR|nr:hypothetical protein KUTeg_018535 [Tegillarca granosa]
MIKEAFVLSFLLSFQYVVNVQADHHYLNEWAAEIKGGIEHAKRVARSHGYELVSQDRRLFGKLKLKEYTLWHLILHKS